MNLIYQIGRFEKNAFESINFLIDNQIFEASLSSLALREYFTKKEVNSKVILLYPVSLLFNKRTIERSSDLLQTFKEKILKILNSFDDREVFFSDPYLFYKLHPHSELADGFSVIHSLGEYEGVKFQATFEELVFEIFLDMVERYIKEPFKAIYLDISSGLNIYVSALIEAGRLFLTFYKLQNFLVEDNSLAVFLYFSDPITQPIENRIFQLHISYKLEVKTFFSHPLPPDVNNTENAYPNFIKSLAGEDKETKKWFTTLLAPILTKSCLFYSALKNNTPLIFYTFSYHKEEDLISAIMEVSKFLKGKIYKDFQKTPGLNIDLYRKLFLVLSLYLGIIRVLKKYDIYPKMEVSISELDLKFRDQENTLYKHFELLSNRRYLAQELDNNFKKEEVKNKFENEYKLLKEFISGESLDKDIKPRNFFAHCGFERNCVEVKRVGDEVYVRYKNDPAILSRLEKMLIDNERKSP